MYRQRRKHVELVDLSSDISMTVPQMRRNQAVINGELKRITPFAHKLLVVLILNRGRLLSRSELIERLYPNPDDEPEGIDKYMARMIGHLRVYGISIETIHTMGYRLIIPTEKRS